MEHNKTAIQIFHYSVNMLYTKKNNFSIET